MPRDNPWEDIGPAAATKINVKRVSDSLKHDFFWARNAEGRYTFLLQIEGDPGEWGPAPELRGIAVGYYRNQRQLQLVLNDRADWEIFLVLCEDLIRAADGLVTPREVMDALMARLVRWQHLLSRGPRKILDETAIRGLIGELLFIRDELMPRFAGKAVEFWQGPERLPQDFVVGGTLFEIKTFLIGDAPRIYISSPSQLWCGMSPLYLAVIPLARCGQQAPGAVTLPFLVEQITIAMAQKPQLEIFESRLVEFGYVPFPEYMNSTYTASRARWYEVREGFPRLISIPAGVVDAKYSIRIDACEPFATEPDWKLVEENAR